MTRDQQAHAYACAMFSMSGCHEIAPDTHAQLAYALADEMRELSQEADGYERVVFDLYQTLMKAVVELPMGTRRDVYAEVVRMLPVT